MRLDHLLSKEHIAACERMSHTVAHGWNVDYSAHTVETISTAFRGVERGGGRVCRARCWVLRERLSWSLPWCRSYLMHARMGVLMVGVWSLFENCTVDASICRPSF